MEFGDGSSVSGSESRTGTYVVSSYTETCESSYVSESQRTNTGTTCIQNTETSYTQNIETLQTEGDYTVEGTDGAEPNLEDVTVTNLQATEIIEPDHDPEDISPQLDLPETDQPQATEGQL